ncbi:MAG: Fur family transcriptional regulator [Bacillota bacterium]|jgi:Fur family peroxide stress response transcriptional regulator
MEVKQKRMTKQKKVIFETLRNTKSHPTADWIYQEVRKTISDISLGTVYRNLQVLKEEGKILELNYGKSQSRFDGNPELHYHFVCKACGRVLDFDIDKNSIKPLILAAAPGEVSTYRLEVYGICHDCKE